MSNADKLTDFTNGTGMDMHFYPLHFYVVAPTEIRGICGDNRNLKKKKRLKRMLVKNHFETSFIIHLIEYRFLQILINFNFKEVIETDSLLIHKSNVGILECLKPKKVNPDKPNFYKSDNV